MLDGAMVDHKIFVYNAARDNNLAALKVSVQQSTSIFALFCEYFFDVKLISTNDSDSLVDVFLLLSEIADFFSWNHLIWFRPYFVFCSLTRLMYFFLSSLSSIWRINEYTRCRFTYHFDEHIEITKYHYISIITRPCADVLFVLYSQSVLC